MRDPGYTPRAKDLDALVEMLADDELVKHAERAIGRLGAQAVERLGERFAAATPPLRARVLKAMARQTDDPRVRATLVAALGDGDPKTRRNAAIALGHLRGEDIETALLAAWSADPRPEMRRSLAASLGKVGSARAVARLEEASASDDPELARIARQARLMVSRTETRADRGRVDDEKTPERPVDVLVLARAGLEEILAQELLDVPAVTDVRVVAPGRVRARLVGPMRGLFGARTMLSFAFPLAQEWVADGETDEDAVGRALGGDVARAWLAAMTVGAPRYRLAWADGGHRRAATWRAAERVQARAPELVNDPSASLWEAVVETEGRFVDVSLAPRGLTDPRFTWRAADVPAASHPTVAAALARLVGARDDDVVWDPFVGSASELVERARLGPCRALFGSDLEPRALASAQKNLDAAGVRATLLVGDATTLRPPGVNVVVTNPPMGRRAVRTSGLADTLDRFVAHVGAVLPPGGRFVWIAPWPERGRTAASQAGLTLDWSRTLDMGGFEAEIQRFVRGRTPSV